MCKEHVVLYVILKCIKIIKSKYHDCKISTKTISSSILDISINTILIMDLFSLKNNKKHEERKN